MDEVSSCLYDSFFSLPFFFVASPVESGAVEGAKFDLSGPTEGKLESCCAGRVVSCRVVYTSSPARFVVSKKGLNARSSNKRLRSWDAAAEAGWKRWDPHPKCRKKQPARTDYGVLRHVSPDRVQIRDESAGV